jgi:hypothetical protein
MDAKSETTKRISKVASIGSIYVWGLTSGRQGSNPEERRLASAIFCWTSLSMLFRINAQYVVGYHRK